MINVRQFLVNALEDILQEEVKNQSIYINQFEVIQIKDPKINTPRIEVYIRKLPGSFSNNYNRSANYSNTNWVIGVRSTSKLEQDKETKVESEELINKIFNAMYLYEGSSENGICYRIIPTTEYNVINIDSKDRYLFEFSINIKNR